MRSCATVQAVAFGCCCAIASSASAQATETFGTRALGMGGAFVAVASDSSATWWNPAGLAAGPFLDLAVSRADQRIDDELPARRDLGTGFALTTPPVGISYYRFRLTGLSDPTGAEGAGREEEGSGVPIHVLAGSQFGVTLVQSLAWGVHAGATIKYVSGRSSTHVGDPAATPSDLLESADALGGGEVNRSFDVDLGFLAVAGPLRIGARVRNLFEPDFDAVHVPRQTRVGVAFDPEPVTGVPLTVAIDADVDRYPTFSGERRVVAVGGEYWVLSRRLGLRAGGRVNTAGARERTASAGASVAIRPGIYMEGYGESGGNGNENGWGIGARVSF